MKSNKNLNEFFIAIAQIFSWLIGTIIIMGSARTFAKWFVPQVLVQSPFLIYLTPFFVLAIFLFALSKRFRERAKRLFFSLFKRPKNRHLRSVFTIGFSIVWFYIVRIIYNESNIESFFAGCFLILPIFFYTVFIWFENGFRDIIKIFIKAGINKKEITRRYKSTANYLSESRKVSPRYRRAKYNISDADEIKKYSELRDLGIITEEEFKAKKKKLLDL